jgi:hypothetical protein
VSATGCHVRPPSVVRYSSVTGACPAVGIDPDNQPSRALVNVMPVLYPSVGSCPTAPCGLVLATRVHDLPPLVVCSSVAPADPAAAPMGVSFHPWVGDKKVSIT